MSKLIYAGDVLKGYRRMLEIRQELDQFFLILMSVLRKVAFTKEHFHNLPIILNGSDLIISVAMNNTPNSCRDLTIALYQGMHLEVDYNTCFSSESIEHDDWIVEIHDNLNWIIQKVIEAHPQAESLFRDWSEKANL